MKRLLLVLTGFRLGIIGIYGLVVAMVLKGKVNAASEGYTLDKVSLRILFL